MYKITSPPFELYRLPFPWNQTITDIRHEYLAVLDKSKPTITKALLALDCSLAVVEWLPIEETFFLPKDLKQNWSFPMIFNHLGNAHQDNGANSSDFLAIANQKLGILEK